MIYHAILISLRLMAISLKP